MPRSLRGQHTQALATQGIHTGQLGPLVGVGDCGSRAPLFWVPGPILGRREKMPEARHGLPEPALCPHSEPGLDAHSHRALVGGGGFCGSDGGSLGTTVTFLLHSAALRCQRTWLSTGSRRGGLAPVMPPQRGQHSASSRRGAGFSDTRQPLPEGFPAVVLGAPGW